MKWIISLVLRKEESLETRAIKVIDYLLSRDSSSKCYISDIEASGETGNTYTEKINIEGGPFKIEHQDLLRIFVENGQVFELQLLVTGNERHTIIIREGNIIDIMGNGPMLPSSVTGVFTTEKLHGFI